MELDKVYLTIFLTLLVAFAALVCIYILYTIQQKVTSVAMTSADVAFFPVRLTASAVRLFFRIVLFGFDVTLLAFKLFLMFVKMILVALETLLVVWRVPIVVLISLVQRLRKLRHDKDKKVKVAAHVAPVTPSKDTKQSEQRVPAKTEDEAEQEANGVFRSTLSRIRMVQSTILRTDLLPVQRLLEAQSYLRKRAGLDKKLAPTGTIYPVTGSTK